MQNKENVPPKKEESLKKLPVIPRKPLEESKESSSPKKLIGFSMPNFDFLGSLLGSTFLKNVPKPNSSDNKKLKKFISLKSQKNG